MRKTGIRLAPDSGRAKTPEGGFAVAALLGSLALGESCISHAAKTRQRGFYRELRVDRIWEGTSEIQRWVISRGVFKRGAAPYLGWE